MTATIYTNYKYSKVDEDGLYTLFLLGSENHYVITKRSNLNGFEVDKIIHIGKRKHCIEMWNTRYNTRHIRYIKKQVKAVQNAIPIDSFTLSGVVDWNTLETYLLGSDGVPPEPKYDYS